MNRFGNVLKACWEDVPRHYSNVQLDAFVIMPNHVHGVVVLTEDPGVPVGAGFKPAPTNVPKRHGLPEIVRAFKTFSAERINETRGTPGATVWQRNYYEHVIRTNKDWDALRQYIAENPMRWEVDQENPLAEREKKTP